MLIDVTKKKAEIAISQLEKMNDKYTDYIKAVGKKLSTCNNKPNMI